jgi:hypothetical protein
LAVEISTGSAKFELSDQECDELARRLARFGAPDAAESLLGHHSIRTEDKPVVREVLGRWRRSVEPMGFSAALVELQEQLGRELWARKHPNS